VTYVQARTWRSRSTPVTQKPRKMRSPSSAFGCGRKKRCGQEGRDAREGLTRSRGGVVNPLARRPRGPAVGVGYVQLQRTDDDRGERGEGGGCVERVRKQTRVREKKSGRFRLLCACCFLSLRVTTNGRDTSTLQYQLT
jgi:hypothetical protein